MAACIQDNRQIREGSSRYIPFADIEGTMIDGAWSAADHVR
jgi:hypothetical protein